MPPPRRLPLQTTPHTIFVDREEAKRSFEDDIFSIPADGCSLRTFYGVGGQGKTALARELFRISSGDVEPTYSHLRRAMIDLHGRPKTDPDLLLVWIRNEFAKVGVSFPAFDLAFAIMWEKIRGESALPNFENAWLRRTGDVLGEAAPETVTLTRELLEESVETIPLLGFLVTKGSRWVFDKSKRAYLEKTRPQLQAFYRQGQLIEDHQMPGLLPWMLAQDLNSHLEVNPDHRFVLFVDEYESVFEGAGTGAKWRENGFDNHLRAFINEANALLTVFFSRERLPWEDDPDWRKDLEGNQILLDGLSDDDASSWLKQVPIEDDEICAAMINGARETADTSALVYPLLLDIQIAHWSNLGPAATPEAFNVHAEAFEGRRRELVQRLLRDYEDPMQQVLTRLAVLMRFDREAFEYIVNKFNIPLVFDAFDRLAELSIMTRSNDGWLSPHRAIAEAIVASSDDAMISNSMDAMIEHFFRRANPPHPSEVNDTTLACAVEARHLRAQGTIDGYFQWLWGVTETINLAEENSFLEDWWRDALSWLTHAVGAKHPETANSYDLVAGYLFAQGKFAEAESHYRKALEYRESVQGKDHPDTAVSYTHVGFALDAQGKAVDAEHLFCKALEIRERVLGQDHPDTASSYNNVASNLDAQGKAIEAEPLHRKALALRECLLGDQHPSTALSYSSLGANLDAQGKALEAEPFHQRAIEISERVLGEDHTVTAASYNNLAKNLNAQGKFVEAEPLFFKALEINERVLGEDHPDTATTYNNVGQNFDAQGNSAAAEPFLRKALENYKQVLGEDHPDIATTYNNVAYNLDMQEKYAEANPYYQKALLLRTRALGPDHPLTAMSCNNLAGNLNAQGKFAEAEPHNRMALEISEGLLGADPHQTATYNNNLAFNLSSQGKYIDAEPFHRKALAIRERVLEKDHLAIATSCLSLADNLGEQEMYSEIEALYRKALDIQERTLGSDHTSTRQTERNLRLFVQYRPN